MDSGAVRFNGFDFRLRILKLRHFTKDVERHLHMYCSTSPCHQSLKGVRDDVWNLRRTINACIPLRDRFSEAKLVHCMEQAPPSFRSSRVDLTGNKEYRD